jgi:hypothetical protein
MNDTGPTVMVGIVGIVGILILPVVLRFHFFLLLQKSESSSVTATFQSYHREKPGHRVSFFITPITRRRAIINSKHLTEFCVTSTKCLKIVGSSVFPSWQSKESVCHQNGKVTTIVTLTASPKAPVVRNLNSFMASKDAGQSHHAKSRIDHTSGSCCTVRPNLTAENYQSLLCSVAQVSICISQQLRDPTSLGEIFFLDCSHRGLSNTYGLRRIAWKSKFSLSLMGLTCFQIRRTAFCRHIHAFLGYAKQESRSTRLKVLLRGSHF